MGRPLSWRPLVLAGLLSVPREAIEADLRRRGLPLPHALEISSAGWLTATFVLSGPLTEPSLRGFAENALLTMRQAMRRYGGIEAYQVILYGPSPGPERVRLYGEERFIEGGSLTWTPTR